MFLLDPLSRLFYPGLDVHWGYLPFRHLPAAQTVRPARATETDEDAIVLLVLQDNYAKADDPFLSG